MTRYELYIDGEKMDVGDVDISLNYKSNLLTDISRIVSNNSYTIKLPKTARNMRLIEIAHLPSSGSVFPYIEHAATVVKNGIEIIHGANVVLMAVNENIEVAITWGASSNFAKIVNDDKSLQELDYGMSNGVDYVLWQKGESYTSRFPRVEYGYKAGETEVWVHPAVTVGWIIGKMESTYGITFDFPADRLSMIESIIVPLITRNDAQKQIDANSVSLLYYNVEEAKKEEGGITRYRTRFIFVGAPSSNYYVSFHDRGLGGTVGFNPKFTNMNLHMKLELRIRVNVVLDEIGDGIVFSLMNPANNVSYATFEPSERILISQDYVSRTYDYVYYIDEDIELVDDSQNSYDLSNYLEFSTNEYTFSKIQSVICSNMDMYFFSETVDLYSDSQTNSRFYFVPNLPDISQIDFLKAITSMLGLFAIPSEADTIKFIPFDTINDNKDIAADWSGKLVKAYRETMPREISYQIDNMAQNNRFKYKEDDTVTGDYDGTVIVDDKNLEYERDAVELPFAASGTRNSVGYIPIYSYSSDGELEFNDSNVEPRILILSGTDGVFEPLAWENLLDDYYSTYREFVKRPKIIKEYVMLNPVELKNLDLTVPVYLRQYGSYFAIVNIKTKDNDICECELLKM